MKFGFSNGIIQINTNGKQGNMNQYIFVGSKKKRKIKKRGK